MSQAKVAALVNHLRGWNWQQTTVQKIEAGTRPLNLDELDALATVLGIPPVELLTSNSDMPATVTRRRRELRARLATLRQTRVILVEQHEQMLERFDKGMHAMERELTELEKNEG